MTALTATLDRLARASGDLAEAARNLADASFLTQVAVALKEDGWPDHAARARRLAIRKRVRADLLLDALTGKEPK